MLIVKPIVGFSTLDKEGHRIIVRQSAPRGGQGRNAENDRHAVHLHGLGASFATRPEPALNIIFGDPADIARAAPLLAREEADFITGHGLVAGGGLMLRL